jgi:Ran GTPase-activating protein (RanGAP) involved in mRNA processing and transport
LGDEEIHIVAAMLRNNVTIEELRFRRNNIGDDGAMALSTILAERSALKLIDLRENRVSINGVKAIAEALERSDRVHKVVVHPGGKIEAFGPTDAIVESESNISAVKSVCIVDLRDNQATPEEARKTANVTKTVKAGCRTRSNSEKKRERRKRLSDRALLADAAVEDEECSEARTHSATK